MHALRDDLQQETVMLWHKDRDLSMFTKDDCIVLPGGFSYGDTLGAGEGWARSVLFNPALAEQFARERIVSTVDVALPR